MWADESEYTGEWREGFPHGFGVLKDKQKVYKGMFVKGKREGEGVVTRRSDGAILFEGKFHQDKPINTSL